MQVYKLTKEQADQLIGEEFIPDCYYYPIQDKNGNWIITENEQKQINPKFIWLQDLVVIEFEPPTENNIFDEPKDI